MTKRHAAVALALVCSAGFPSCLPGFLAAAGFMQRATFEERTDVVRLDVSDDSTVIVTTGLGGRADEMSKRVVRT